MWSIGCRIFHDQALPALFKWRHFKPEIIVCAVRCHSLAALNTPASFGSSCATARTRAPPDECSCRRPERLALRVHTLPPCTPLRCSIKHNKPVMFTGTEVWWSTFRPPRIPAYAPFRGLLLHCRLYRSICVRVFSCVYSSFLGDTHRFGSRQTTFGTQFDCQF